MSLNDNSASNGTAFSTVFGQGKKTGNVSNIKPAAAADRPKAQLWLNLGYTIDVNTNEGVVQEFVALPQGIPLDTMELLPANSQNDAFRARQMAQNDLITKIIEKKGAALEPGESTIINLQVQLRRVKADAAEIPADANPYIAELDL